MGKLLDSLNEYGWAQNRLAYSTGEKCLIGHATSVYVGFNIFAPNDTTVCWQKLPVVVRDALTDAVREVSDVIGGPLCNIVTFNDHPGRSEEDIRLVMKYADEIIDSYEAEYGPVEKRVF